MELIGEGLHYLWSFVLVLSVIVFVHEFGHYLVAKLCGVKVITFSIGFGPELFGFNDRSGTRWKFAALPFGGYVKMFGDQGAASAPDNEALDTMTAEERNVSFHHKALWQKALVVSAGPLANFVLTISIITFFIYTIGVASTDPIIGEVMPDTPAQKAGLQAQDRILSVDGTAVKEFGDIPNMIATNLGEPVELKLVRDGKEITLSITPIEFEDKDALGNPVKRPLIGIRSQKMTIQNFTFPQAVIEATERTYKMCAMSLHYLWQMISGQRSADSLRGPVGIAQMPGQVTQTGDTLSETARTILWFIAMLSANLGLINLLPIPLLDGGHLMYYLVEALSGRPLAKKFQEYGFRLGFLMIASLMAFSLYNDIRNIFL